MDHVARYQALVDFLLPYQEIWRNEIMLQYPRPLDAFDPAWLEELGARIGPEEAWRLTQGWGWDKLRAPGLFEFHHQLVELCDLPQAQRLAPLVERTQTWVHIIPKKQHEIERLAPLIAHQLKPGSRLVDIGGGQGHLAQTIAHHYGVPVTSLDMDAELQRIGRHWQDIKWPGRENAVTFSLHRIERRDSQFAALLGPDCVTSGLHTCGPLAVAHMEAAVMGGATLVNMPCCYHKLQLEDCGLSNLSQRAPLPWNQFALTLASGAHHKASEKDIAFRSQVKRYRYTLHFLLHDELSTPGHVTLGNCPEALYYGPFAGYAREQLRRLGLVSLRSDDQLEAYYHDPRNQQLVRGMLAATIVRDRFGRALEVALICDRLVWLEEQGYHAEVYELFDPQVSPRNLVIIAKPQ